MRDIFRYKRNDKICKSEFFEEEIVILFMCLLRENYIRSGSCTAEIMNHFFDNSGIAEPSHIWDTDETSFKGDYGKLFVICRRGSRLVLKLISDNNKTSYTVNKYRSVDGVFLSPFILYKLKNRYDTWVTKYTTFNFWLDGK